MENWCCEILPNLWENMGTLVLAEGAAHVTETGLDVARGSNETDRDGGVGRARRRNAQQLVTVLFRRLARKDQVYLC